MKQEDKRQNTKSIAGFTLLEVTIALGILALGIAPVIALFSGATAAHQRAIHSNHAGTVALWAIADIEMALRGGVNPDDLKPGEEEFEDLIRPISTEYPGYNLSLAFFTEASDSEVGILTENELILELTIEWKARSTRQKEVFRQIVTQTHRIR